MVCHRQALWLGKLMDTALVLTPIALLILVICAVVFAWPNWLAALIWICFGISAAFAAFILFLAGMWK
jgi:hypothetical protein